MRRVGAITSSSRRSRGFNLNQTTAPAPAAQQSLVAQRTSSIALARLRDLALLPALAVLIVIGAVISPVFLTSGNINTILTSSAVLALVVLAEAIGIVTVLVIGGLVGFINGFMVVKLRLSAFIVTLAMLIILRGMLVGATHGRTLFDLPAAFYGLLVITFLGLPLAVWLAALAFVIAGVMLRYHRLGRALYAIGGNPEAARAAGIRVERITWGVYVLAGMLAALGGLAITGYVGAISANQGNGLIFTVFAAAVIGGISLDGGKGTMFGALTGVLLLGVVGNLLTLAQVPSFWIQAIYGAIILGSLMVARFAGGQSQE